jgi:hypothetical protein
VNFVATADYSEASQLDIIVKGILGRIARSEDLASAEDEAFEFNPLALVFLKLPLSRGRHRKTHAPPPHKTQSQPNTRSPGTRLNPPGNASYAIAPTLRDRADRRPVGASDVGARLPTKATSPAAVEAARIGAIVCGAVYLAVWEGSREASRDPDCAVLKN